MENNFVRFARDCPGAYFLQANDSLTDYLHAQSFLTSDEVIRQISKAGEGNMNLTLRVQTNQRSFIIKQSRPWVEKYPQLAAPWDRVLSEAKFYELVGNLQVVASKMPRILSVDRDSRILLLEDLGTGGDYTSLYQGERLSEAEISALAIYLSTLHSFVSEPVLANLELRQLNHAHIFEIPLQSNNGLDLDQITPGLSSVANSLKNNLQFRNRAAELGKLYLAEGPTLLHGDFYPGSWLKTNNGLRVIDPEFAYFGCAEFEVGVLRAHLILTQNDFAWPVFAEKYRESEGFDPKLMVQFSGIEIMRRLMGYAQLPLTADLTKKTIWLDLATAFVLA